MSDQTTNAGRGVLFIAVAKFYFLIAGYVIYFILPRLLHSEVSWGNYLLVTGLVSVINNMFVTSTIQAVSKFTAQDNAQSDSVKKAALKMQLFLGGGITALYLIAAPFIAHWERDPSLTKLYQLSAGIMFCYAFYAVFVGSVNGLRQFGRQATLDMTFATMRVLFILGGAFLGLGAVGAIGGWDLAAALILLISILWVRWPSRSSVDFSLRELWNFLAQIFLYNLMLNLIMRVDLFLVKRFAAQLSTLSEAVARADEASKFAGYYGTAQTLAFIPYQAILAVAFVIFPLISRATFDKELATTQSYIRQTLRMSLIFTVGVAIMFVAHPAEVITILYPKVYSIGGEALRILALGMVSFSLFTIINTILNGAGRTGQALIVGAITLALAVGANTLLLPRAASLNSALTTAAWATSGAITFGTILAAVFLLLDFRAGFPKGSVLRVMIAALVAIAAARWMPVNGKLMTLVMCMVSFAVYLIVLIALREFNAEDTQKIKKILRRG